MSTTKLDVEACRRQFPSLKQGFIFAENAGGSQCLSSVAQAVSDYLLYSNAQLGATYKTSIQATHLVTEDAPSQTASFIHASGGKQEIAFGSSSTALVRQVAEAMQSDVEAGQEIIVTLMDHEANVGPWLKLAERKGLGVKFWRPSPLESTSSVSNPFAVGLQHKDLQPLLSSKTRLVAFTACSNIAGYFTDVKAIVGVIRSTCKKLGAHNVQICVDAVAYAPHRRVDVQDWGVDYAFFSWYKVYGPHISVMYASIQAQERLNSLAHYFIPSTSYPAKLQPGGPNHELTASTRSVIQYLASLGDGSQSDSAIDEAFVKIAQHEQELMKVLFEGLQKWYEHGLRIVGPETCDSNIRAPTVSFVVVDSATHKIKIKSQTIVEGFDQTGKIGIRHGSCYANRFIGDVLGLDPDDGVVRISFVHYNTVEEVREIVTVLDRVMTQLLAKKTS